MSYQMTTLNRFVRVAAAAAAIGLAASPVLAQGTQGPEGPPPADSVHGGRHHGPHGPGHAAMLLKGITLSDAQKAQLRTIQQNFRTSMESLRQGGQKPDREQMRARMDAHLNEIRGVLTAQQQPVFDDNVRQMKAHMEQHRQEHMQHMQHMQQQGAPAPQGR